MGSGYAVLSVHKDPGLKLDQMPNVDVVLLGHEDHPDNLDELRRQLLDGRRVFTTQARARSLATRPSVVGMAPGESNQLVVGRQQLEVIATPRVHAPTGECTGFVITAPEFGSTSGLPNAIWFSGDTIYLEELRDVGKKYHINVALMNLGAAKPGNLQITMSAHDGARLFSEINADVLVPMHFDAWDHFTEGPEAGISRIRNSRRDLLAGAKREATSLLSCWP